MNGRPWAPPTALRMIKVPLSSKVQSTSNGEKKNINKETIHQGYCGKCEKWIDVEGIRNADVAVVEIYVSIQII